MASDKVRAHRQAAARTDRSECRSRASKTGAGNSEFELRRGRDRDPDRRSQHRALGDDSCDRPSRRRATDRGQRFEGGHLLGNSAIDAEPGEPTTDIFESGDRGREPAPRRFRRQRRRVGETRVHHRRDQRRVAELGRHHPLRRPASPRRGLRPDAAPGKEIELSPRHARILICSNRADPGRVKGSSLSSASAAHSAVKVTVDVLQVGQDVPDTAQPPSSSRWLYSKRDRELILVARQRAPRPCSGGRSPRLLPGGCRW